MRNSVRLKLVPQLKVYNLNIKEIILQTILLLTEDNLYLENKAAEALEKSIFSQNTDEIKMDVPKILSLESPIQGRLLRLAIERIKGNLTQLSFTHVQAILAKLGSTEKWELHLPDGINVGGDKNSIAVSLGKPEIKTVKPFKYALPIPGEIRISEVGGTLRGSFVGKYEKGSDPKIAFLDFGALGKDIIVRSKLPGDRFTPLGIKGSKKLQDFFVDEKVPADVRDSVPIVESGGRVVWVAGMRIDDSVKVTDKTRKIVKLELL